jgi:hypothetical protein
MIPGVIGSGKNVDRKALKGIWDNCKIKDLPFEEFCTQIEELTDPIAMARDLARIRQGVRP